MRASRQTTQTSRHRQRSVRGTSGSSPCEADHGVGAGAYRVGMAYAVQVTIDSTDPHALADWWAETLGWRVEASDETFIRRMISEGHATDADTLMHRGALVWREGAAIHPADEQLPRVPRIYFQMVPEAKTVKNHVHLDVRTDVPFGRSI
jgi:Glyoxalase-like domain